MNNNTTQNRMISYFLVVFSLFILLMFTKDLFFELQSLKDEQQTVARELEDKEQERQELIALRDEQVEGVEQYTKELKENEMIQYIYGVAEKVNTSSGRGLVAIKSLSISEGTKNDLGFMESQVDLEVQVGSEKKMTTLLDELVSPAAEYKFFIDTFSYETPAKVAQSSSGKPTPSISSYTVNIPLRFFYK